MAKRKRMSNKAFRAAWDATPKTDQRFIWTSAVIYELLGSPTLRYRELPTRLNRTLGQADRNLLFSLIVECVGRLSDAQVLGRVRKMPRRRAVKRGRST